MRKGKGSGAEEVFGLEIFVIENFDMRGEK